MILAAQLNTPARKSGRPARSATVNRYKRRHSRFQFLAPEICQSRGIDQSGFASLTGLSIGYVNDLWTGKAKLPSDAILVRICDALELENIGQLLHYTPPKIL